MLPTLSHTSIKPSRQRFFIRLGALVLGFLTIASLVFVGVRHAQAAGTTYYVATNGSDTNSGLATGSAFQHIQRCATVAQAGDTCLIESGAYHETVTPANSGTSGAPIVFRPDVGASVTIDGADAVTGWSTYSGSIYQASVTLPVSGYQDSGFFANQVFVDGQMVNEARWPNTGSDLEHPTEATAGASSTCGSSSSTIYDSSLPSGNWVGATIHLRGGYAWTAQTGTVTAYSAGQSVTFSGGNYDCSDLGAKPGSKYYLTNGPLSGLDSAGEWYYDGSAHKIYLWTPSGDSPANHTVEAKQRTDAFDLSGKSYIEVAAMSTAAATVLTDSNSSNDTLDALTATYISHFVTLPLDNSHQSGCDIYCTHIYDSGIILNGSNNTLMNSTIAYSAGNGVSLQGTNNTVTNNLIYDTDYSATYDAIVELIGTGATVTHNTMYNTGRDGITGGSTNDTFAYNDIFNFGELNQDLGGIYICCANITGTGSSISHNWLHDNQAKSDRGFSGASLGEGVYLDNGANGFLVDHNVIWNNGDRGIFFHGNGGPSDNNKAYNNTLGPGQPSSIAIFGASNYTGTSVINNIALGSIDSQSGVTYGNNLPASTNPLFVNPSANDFHLQSGSPARGAGQAISGVTAAGVTNPDEGAYEGADWVPGCSFSGCTNDGLTAYNDSVTGSGTDQFNYSGSWGASSLSTCYAGDNHYDNTTNDSVSFQFSGTQISLYTSFASNNGIAGITLDSGVQSTVDLYSSTGICDGLAYTSPLLSNGTHTLTVRVTGNKNANASADYISIDRAVVTTAPATSYNDNITGSGTNQFNYSGSWGSSGSTTCYQGDNHWDNTTNDIVSFPFSGTHIALYTSFANNNGIASIAIDGGTATTVDLYSSTGSCDKLAYISPALSSGSHTLTVHVTGTKNSSATNDYVSIDRVSVTP